jgi:uncharacterized protein (DUF1501 family)
MSLNRRQWLQAASLGGALAFLPSTRMWAAPPNGARLVVVMLRGAYDGLSALVPYSESFYYESRPSIAIPRPTSQGSVATSQRLDGRWALHPALADSAGELFSSQQLAFVPFCGTGFVSRSHFQAQDWMETGKLPEQRPDVNDGFLNRLVVQLGGQAVSFTPNLPVAFRGKEKVANAAVNRGQQRGQTGVRAERFNEQVLAMYEGHALEPLVREGLNLRQALSVELMQEMEDSGREALPAAGFAMEALRVARYMREHAQVNVAFIDVGGWDTHANQGAVQGLLASRLGALGTGVETIAKELGAQWRNTVVVVMSEFGRTFRENGSKGTDHGHGNLMWVAGGSVAGGAIRGEQARLDATSLHQGRDLPVLNEYRAVLSGLFASMYGLRSGALAEIFPGAQGLRLGLI